MTLTLESPKSIFKILVLTLISILVWAGCETRTGTNESKEKTQITAAFLGTVGSRAYTTMYPTLVKSFEEIHPQVKVKLELEPADGYENKIMTRIASGTAPDIFEVYYGNIPIYAEKGTLQSLDSFIEEGKEFEINDYNSKILTYYKYKGKLYGIPQGVDVLGLFYNKRLFDKVGVKYPDESWTWEDLLNACARLTQDIDADGKVDVYGIDVSTYWGVWIPWVWQNGGRILNDEGTECLMDEPGVIEALEWYFNSLGKYAPSDRVMASLGGEIFLMEKLAMSVSGHCAVSLFRQKKDLLWDVAPLPRGKRKATFQHGRAFVISSTTKHPKETWQFFKTVVGSEGQSLNAEYGLNVPTLKTVAKSEFFIRPDLLPEHHSIFVDELEYAKSLPANMRFGEVTDVLGRELSFAQEGKKTIAEACRDAKVQISRLLKGE